MNAQYVIGIDLGTTNSVLAYTSLEEEEPKVNLLSIPQVVASGTVESRSSLPSFLYQATQKETESGIYDLSWTNNRSFVVGAMARQQGAEMPDRTVGAAKSWLCHSKIDRHQEILPWNAPEDVTRISPVTATRLYLEHLIAVWEQTFPEAPISDQEVVLTVPASFDASARELTREAALAAGLPGSVILIEEPQAAVYAWLDQMGDSWRKQLQVGDQLLVCDVGGGTTDLTLVSVSEEQGELMLTRQAVGNHLLVGGDNMDLALAHFVSGLFAEKGVQLDPWQSVSLWHSCRAAKEDLLSDEGAEQHPISVLGRGSKLIGGTVTVDVSKDQVCQLLGEGFFPQCALTDTPLAKRTSGFQEIGLPYESDTGITRHIAGFLTSHADENSDPIRPTHLLLNGGVFKSHLMSRRLMETLNSWFPKQPTQLLAGSHDLDHAVARGASYYGWAKSHGGIRIRGGTARSYYVGIETSGLAIPGAPRPLQALCVVPMGMEEGTEHDVPSNDIGLVVGELARFRFFCSSIRKDDEPGTVLPRWSEEELIETDALETVLDANEQLAETPYVPVRFHANITELGVLELWCQNTKGDDRWKLEFNVREESE